MERELLVLAAFAGVSIVFTYIENHVDLHKDKLHELKHRSYLAAAATWLIHPATLHALHEYGTHLMVYSGYVLTGH